MELSKLEKLCRLNVRSIWLNTVKMDDCNLKCFFFLENIRLLLVEFIFCFITMFEWIQSFAQSFQVRTVVLACKDSNPFKEKLQSFQVRTGIVSGQSNLYFIL